MYLLIEYDNDVIVILYSRGTADADSTSAPITRKRCIIATREQLTHEGYLYRVSSRTFYLLKCLYNS